MISKEQAIDRLHSTYSKYGVSREVLTEILTDGIEQQGFTPQEVYNLVRMSLGREFGEREYFAVSEIAAMLGMTEKEVMNAAEKANAGNEALLSGFRMFFPQGIK